MRRSPRNALVDERGGVLALSAILIPITLLIVAMAFDVGTWYTHKRQLQNRADAGALAAGVEYGSVFASCETLSTKAAAATALDTAARRYAGDPNLGTRYNTEVTDDGWDGVDPAQSRINVEINPTPPKSVDPGTSWNDPGAPTTQTGQPARSPCEPQPADTFSPADAYYVDVGVREINQRSLFGMFGVDLLRNTAHARVALLTALAGNGFLPIALPDQDIRQAQIRYYRQCAPVGQAVPTTPLQVVQNGVVQDFVELNTLATAYQNIPGSTVWGPTASSGAPGTPAGVQLNIPQDTSCSPGPNSVYMPVRMEVRIAGVDSNVVNLANYSCSQLVDMPYVDCWDQVSDFSVDGGDPRTQPWFHQVELTGDPSGAARLNPPLCAPDAYFAKPPIGVTSCTYGVRVTVDWNGLEVPASPNTQRRCTIGSLMQPGCPNGVWSFGSSNSTFGPSPVNLTWSCDELDLSTNNPNDRIPCGGNTVRVHSAFLGNRANSGVITLARTSAGTQPGSELHWVDAPQGGPGTVTVFPTLGLEGALRVGQRKVLRVPHCAPGQQPCVTDQSSPSNSQSIDCEPTTQGQGHDFVMFANGCRPYYTPNEYTNADWWPCPTKPSPGSPQAPWDANSEGEAWQCVVKAPGFSPNVIANGIAAAIGNCAPNANNRNANSCNPQSFNCVNPNFYDPAHPTEWSVEDGSQSPRVVFLFIVPYGAYKGSSSQDVLPLLNFAAFYVSGWKGSNGQGHANPCTSDPAGDALPDECPVERNPLEYMSGNGNSCAADEGSISGYFVTYALPGVPGDPDAACVIGQLRPCTAVLVR